MKRETREWTGDRGCVVRGVRCRPKTKGAPARKHCPKREKDPGNSWSNPPASQRAPDGGKGGGRAGPEGCPRRRPVSLMKRRVE